MMDRDGYPEEDELYKLSHWDMGDPQGWIEYAQSLWKYDEYFTEKDFVWCISTGGWSGNESVIYAMQDNYILWGVCFLSLRRGGHYMLEVPECFRRRKSFSDSTCELQVEVIVATVGDQPFDRGMYKVEVYKGMADGKTLFWDAEKEALIYKGPVSISKEQLQKYGLISISTKEKEDA